MKLVNVKSKQINKIINFISKYAYAMYLGGSLVAIGAGAGTTNWWIVYLPTVILVIIGYEHRKIK